MKKNQRKASQGRNAPAPLGRQKRGPAASEVTPWTSENDILVAIQDGIWVEDAGGFCVFANDRAAKILGYDRASGLVGKHWTEVVAPDEHPHVQERLSHRKRANHSTYQTILLRRNGLRVPILVSASSLRDGRAYRGSVALLIDYTD